MYRRQQQGVALISVLLVFALITVLAADMLAVNYRDIKKTQHQFSSKQAYYYALAGEELARQLLYRDMKKQDGSDGFKDNWAQPLESYQIDQGTMTIELIDLQSRFNINNLLADSDTINPSYVQAFKQLQSQLDTNPDITAALLDWLDSNQQLSAGGAEDIAYSNKTRPYVTANQPLYDNTELRLLEGLSYQAYTELAEQVSTLPRGSKINLNTATAKVLKAVLPSLNESELDQIKQLQNQGGLAAIATWLQQPFGHKLKNQAALFSVNSEYFEVQVKSLYDGRVARLSTTLYRNANKSEITTMKRHNE
ncbi:type II secretion system minor pseudopilin GspK [Dasania marina]|uniref:type II secretion system minor pseudopilin GspK n=1 Tax=Dasania marina TaxID=471499 RepID=UPI000362AEEB|nr:type II secretion system minor pseudopilin GspK [Dasania marina]